jgi:hypothetical protein
MGPIVQTGITLLAVGLASAYLGRRVVRQLRGRGESKCAGCSASGSVQTLPEVSASRRRMSRSKPSP